MREVYRKVAGKLICLCLCFVLMISTFSACKKESSTSIWLPLSALPTCFDPQISGNIDTENIINNCFEGLVRIDASGNIQKGVANNWTISPDRLTYTFNLRSDAKWYLPNKLDDILGEGYEKTFNTSVTAADFEFAIERALNPETMSPLANTLSAVSSVVAKDATTLVINLSKPNVNFLSVLATPACMPCNKQFFEATAGRYGLEADLLLYNGPYRIKNVDETTGVLLTQNENYKGEYTPIVGTAKFLLASAISTKSEDDNDTTVATTSITEATTASTFQLLTRPEGGLDAGSVTAAESSQLDSTFEIQKYKNVVKTLCFNAESKSLADENIRLAMIYATSIDILRGNSPKAEGAVPACCGLAPGVSYRAGSNIVAPHTYDEAKAAQYVAKAYQAAEDTNTLSINFVCLKEDENDVKKMLQAWQKIFGVPLSVSVTTFTTQPELDAAIQGGAYDVAYTKLIASEFLASDFLNRFSSGAGTNIIHLNSTEYDNLLTKIYNAPNEASLVAANKAAEEYLLNSGYLLPVCQCDSYLAVKETAKGLTVRPSGTIYALYK